MAVKYFDNFRTTLATGVAAGATSFTVANAANAPAGLTSGAGHWCHISIGWDGQNEVRRCTEISGTTIACDAFEGDWAAGTPVTLALCKGLIDDLFEAAGSAVSGDVDGPSSATNGNFALFDGTTGKLLKQGGTPGDAATKSVGTTAGTVAAGDHNHSGTYATAAQGANADKIELVAACSDESTALTTGTAKVTFRAPCAFTLTAVRASLTVAQASGSVLTVDINEGGTSVLSTKLTIDNTEKTSTTAATAAVISDSAIADDAEITVDIDQVGDGTAKGLKVTLIGTRA